MEKSDQINELATALAKAQGELESASKNALNPHFKNKYADLASVWDAARAPLSKHGLSVAQTVTHCPEGITVLTVLLHSSGQWLSSSMPLLMGRQDMQGLGSAITYARRYSLAAICGISQDDDDGEGSVGRTGGPKVAANDDSEWIANNPSIAGTTNVVNRHTVIPRVDFTPPDNAGAFVCQCGAPIILSREKTHYYCRDYKNESVSHTKSFKAVI